MEPELKEASPQAKILCVGGSPRRGGNTDTILKRFNEAISERTMSEIVNLRDYYYHPCIGCEQCRKEKHCTGQIDAMQLIYPKIVSSQALLLVSPTHNYNVTSWIKSFIDRLYCYYEFGNDVPRSWSSRLSGQNRKAVIAAVCEQKDKKDMGFTLEAMRLPLEALGYEIIDELAVFKIFKRAGIKEEPDILEHLTEKAIKLENAIYG